LVERKGARVIFIRQDCQGMQNLLKPANENTYRLGLKAFNRGTEISQ
jgi:hypothetical protein